MISYPTLAARRKIISHIEGYSDLFLLAVVAVVHVGGDGLGRDRLPRDAGGQRHPAVPGHPGAPA